MITKLQRPVLVLVYTDLQGRGDLDEAIGYLFKEGHVDFGLMAPVIEDYATRLIRAIEAQELRDPEARPRRWER